MTEFKSASTRYLYVDLCFTIVKENTTFKFIKYVIQKEGMTIQKILYALYMSKFFSVWQSIVKPTKYTRSKLLLKLLTGVKRDVIEDHAHEYAKNALSYNSRENVINKIKDAQECGVHVTILSASIDPVVKAFANILSTDYICSTLAYKNKLVTGTLKFDMTGQKSRYVSTALHTTMITDNFEDIEMQNTIDEFYIVLKQRSHKKIWDRVSKVKGYIS